MCESNSVQIHSGRAVGERARRVSGVSIDVGQGDVIPQHGFWFQSRTELFIIGRVFISHDHCKGAVDLLGAIP
jgi:hypothetical protein